MCVKFTDCNKFLLSGYRNGYIRIWDIENMIMVSSFKKTQKAINDIKLSN